MKTLLTLLALTVVSPSFARSLAPVDRVDRNEFSDLEAHQVMAQTGTKTIITIGRKVTHGCYPNFRYQVTKAADKFFVTREPVYHIMIVCTNPHTIIEGAQIELESDQTFVEVFAPKGDEVKLGSEGL